MFDLAGRVIGIVSHKGANILSERLRLLQHRKVAAGVVLAPEPDVGARSLDEAPHAGRHPADIGAGMVRLMTMSALAGSRHLP